MKVNHKFLKGPFASGVDCCCMLVQQGETQLREVLLCEGPQNLPLLRKNTDKHMILQEVTTPHNSLL